MKYLIIALLILNCSARAEDRPVIIEGSLGLGSAQHDTLSYSTVPELTNPQSQTEQSYSLRVYNRESDSLLVGGGINYSNFSSNQTPKASIKTDDSINLYFLNLMLTLKWFPFSENYKGIYLRTEGGFTGSKGYGMVTGNKMDLKGFGGNLAVEVGYSLAIKDLRLDLGIRGSVMAVSDFNVPYEVYSLPMIVFSVGF